jgi:enediyne biosynthesis protein E4
MSAATVGLEFTNTLSSQRGLTNQMLLNGSGVALGDYDQDGRTDIFFAGMDHGAALFRNLGGWRFTNATASAFGGSLPEGGLTNSSGAAMADLDGDGLLDFVVNIFGGGTRVFRNRGAGRLEPWGSTAGLDTTGAATSLALADVDGDGDLDLYVANYRFAALMDSPGTRFSYRYDAERRPVLTAVNGVPVDDPSLRGRFQSVITPDGRLERIEFGEPDRFYLNDGQGSFRSVPFESGAFLNARGQTSGVLFDWGLSALFADLNDDGRPDLYVCNDFHTPDRLWWNETSANGLPRFREAPGNGMRHTSEFAMGVDAADFNRDGHPDLLVVEMLSRSHRRRLSQVGNLKPLPNPPGSGVERPQYSRNVLQINRGDGTFAEVAALAGIDASEWSWAVAAMDVDLDGFEDVLVTTGNGRDSLDQDMLDAINEDIRAGNLAPVQQVEARRRMKPLLTRTQAFRNRGNLTFEEVGEQWGLTDVGIGHGMALGDLDGDGDLDAVINRLNASPLIYRNESRAPRLAVRLKGNAPNTLGIGARITVHGARVIQGQEMRAGGRYLSSDEPLRVFAPGATNHIEVRWPSGKFTWVSNVPPNRLCVVMESEATAGPAKAPKASQPWFDDVSPSLGHSHSEADYDDFSRQPGLTLKLSQLGPGVAWWDIDGDGTDELVIGGGTGGRLAMHRFEHGAFKVVDPRSAALPGDHSAMTGFGTNLLMGLSGYESDSELSARVLSVAADVPPLPPMPASVGPLTAADVDGDGSLELLVGGGAVPGRFPAAAPTRLWRRTTAGWEVNEARSPGEIGPVHGAVFCDLNGDGRPELLTTTAWGPVRLHTFTNEALREITEPTGLAELRGWWTGIATGDFDEDGRMDFVAGNWGLNSNWKATREHPMHLYAGDFNGIGMMDLVEARFEPELGGDAPQRIRDVMSRVILAVPERFPTHATYAGATVPRLLAKAVPPAGSMTTLATTLFLNRGGRFEARALPAEAQWAPVFGVCVADADGDGHEDVFLAQNLFATAPDVPRQDAGRGLWLRGDGHGGLRAVPGQESGVVIWGEQRGAAVGDFDADGRVDLVVAQNADATKVFRNATALHGVRVRLTGPPGNPTAIGARIRWQKGARRGPQREVQAGSGWWSQNSVTQIISIPEAGGEIRVRWPDGREQTLPAPSGGSELRLRWAEQKAVP